MNNNIPLFNYCDYRCDRCDIVGDCKVNLKVNARKMLHILDGEDPNSPESFARDISESLMESMMLLDQMAKERGIDLNVGEDTGDEYEKMREASKNHPLLKQAHAFMDRCGEFLDESRKNVLITPEIERFFEDIESVRFLIPPKAARAVMRDDLDDDEFAREDSCRTAGLIIRCLTNTAKSLEKIIFYRPETEEKAMNLKKMTAGMIEDWRLFLEREKSAGAQ